MKTITFYCYLFLFCSTNVFAVTRHVSPTGNNANAGTFALPWQTITYAASAASGITAGDTVYVKAGDYGAEEPDFQTSGTSGNPICFIGYKTVPGDAPPIGVFKTNKFAAFDPLDMPTLTGADRSTDAYGMDIRDVDYIVLKNFQIRKYTTGVFAGATGDTTGHHVLYNINCRELGDVSGGYNGFGLRMGTMSSRFTDYNTIDYCLIVNTGIEGITLCGDFNTLDHSYIIGNDGGGDATGYSMNYYVTIVGSYNVMLNCYVREYELSGTEPHGISIKSNAEMKVDLGSTSIVIDPRYNYVANCIAYDLGESFCVRHRGVQYNTFENCTSYGTGTGSGREGSCVVIRDGASNNLFRNIKCINTYTAISFFDTVEDGDTGGVPPGHPGHGNRIINLVAIDCYRAIDFLYDGAPIIQKDVGNNLIQNCTFYKCDRIISATTSCDSIKYIGNIFVGKDVENIGGWITGSQSADVLAAGTYTYFKDCDFFSIEGGMPGGFVTAAVGSISSDPKFTDAVNGDFRLQATSPCLNLVDNEDKSVVTYHSCRLNNKNDNIRACGNNHTNDIAITRDFQGVICPVGSYRDIGAFEYINP